MIVHTLDTIRDCLEGNIPAILATCDAAGCPNVSLVSQVHYVDPERVAVSHQFFNKTRHNIQATGCAAIELVDPLTAAEYRLELDHQETLTEGPLFETMKAKLAGIASHTGMRGVFRLLGADVFRVRSIARLPGPAAEKPPACVNLLSAARRTCGELACARDLGDLVDRALEALARSFGVEHAMVLLLDERRERLYTVASRGYPAPGIGSEVMLGEGVIGVAARERVPIRIGHMTGDYGYGAAIRDEARNAGMNWAEMTAIPFPGLGKPESQIALPILNRDRAIGVLFAESPHPMRFWYDDEDALALVADRLGALIPLVQGEATVAEAGRRLSEAALPVVVRHYAVDDSIFINHDYLIKGVAGAIFWKLVREHAEEGRIEFTNRELRLDPALRLPEHAENLEARLILLQRRLRERDSVITIEKTGRGRFRLCLPAGVQLEEMHAVAEAG